MPAPVTKMNYLKTNKEKRALVVQCSYKGTPNALPGTVADCEAFRQILTRNDYDTEILRDDIPFAFRASCLEEFLTLCLASEPATQPANPPPTKTLTPTKANIIAKFKEMNKWLSAKGNRQGWIVFCGHGTQTIDRTGEEKDGKDEAIVPIDFQRSGLIKDDQLKDILGTIKQPTSSLMIIFDCCHSGTMMDFPYRLTHRIEPPEYDPGDISKIGKVFCVSAALDEEVAFETREGGVLTRAFLSCHVAGQSPGQMLRGMQAYADRRNMKQHISMHSTHPFAEGDTKFIEGGHEMSFISRSPTTSPLDQFLNCILGGNRDSRAADRNREVAMSDKNEKPKCPKPTEEEMKLCREWHKKQSAK